MAIGNRIKLLREKCGYSQTDFADKIGVSKQTLYKYENDIVTNIPSDKVEAIASVCNVSPSYIMGWDNDTFLPHSNIISITKHKLPVLSAVVSGVPVYAEEQFEYSMPSDTEIKADCILRSKDESMVNARVHSGDIVFVQIQSSVENGQIAVVGIGDEVVLRRVYSYPDKQKLVLNAENPAYEPLVYVGNELEQVHILGKAMAFQSYVK
jgi:repressor LexA